MAMQYNTITDKPLEQYKGQHAAIWDKTRQYNIKPCKAIQDNTRQCKPIQYNIMHDNIRQTRARQDNTREAYTT